MPSITIRQLTDPAEADAVGQIVGRAFISSRGFTEEIPDPAERLRHCVELYTGDVRSCLRYGSVWIAQSETGAILGAITQVDMPARSAAVTDYRGAGSGVPSAEWTEMVTKFDALEGVGLEAIAATQTGPWRYISVLAVDPSQQGAGIGTVLMHHSMAVADQDGLALGIMTEVLRTVRYYERLGFPIIAAGNEHDPIRYWVQLRPSADPVFVAPTTARS